jgi:DeoR family transcriptional regulator of aga operon
MTHQAKQVVVVADSSGVGMIGPAVIYPFYDIDILITDDGISEDALDAFNRSGVKVMSA